MKKTLWNTGISICEGEALFLNIECIQPQYLLHKMQNMLTELGTVDRKRLRKRTLTCARAICLIFINSDLDK